MVEPSAAGESATWNPALFIASNFADVEKLTKVLERQSSALIEIETIEVRGTKIKSYKNALPNIRALWLSTVPFAEREYLIYQEERMTYAQANEQVNAIASWL